MKLTTCTVAAVLLLSATAASASPLISTTDEATVLAGRVQPTGEPATVAATPARFPLRTDEARALAHGSIPASSPQVLIGAEGGLTIDQARALAGGAIRAAAPAKSTANIT